MASAFTTGPDTPTANSLAALTKSGFDRYYNTNYEAAIRDFEKVLASKPDDPAAMNHLLTAYIFRELYHAGALNTTMYSGDSFVAQKRPVKIDAKARAKIDDLIERSNRICAARLDKLPSFAVAPFFRVVTLCLRAVLLVFVYMSWSPALRCAGN